MSKIRSNKRLTVEEFPEQKDWIGKLFQQINDFVTETIKIVNGGITFTDNVSGADHEFDFTYQTDAISLPIGFTWPLAVPPKALQVVNATANLSPVILVAAWDYTQTGLVRLTSVVQVISGSPGSVSILTANVRYRIRVRVTP